MTTIKVKNPFIRLKDYNCFGCSPNNPIGLKLSFEINDNYIISYWKPTKNYEGWVDTLHGGIQSALLDEIANWYVFVFFNVASVTYKMEVYFRKKIKITDNTIKLKAYLIQKKKNFAYIKAELYDSLNELCSEGTITCFLYNLENSVRLFNFPINKNEFF